MHASEQRHATPPFPAFPSTSRYIPLGAIAEAMTRVCRSVDAREGVSLVVGPPGTGKSLLCSLLAKHYSETHDVVVLGETPIPSSAAYQRSLLHHLGSNYRNLDESELQLALVDRVSDSKSTNEGLLIIADEAQGLSAEVLESIRMSTNIHRQGEPRVFAVVVGGVKLDDTLTSPELEGFTQRIAARCYLHPMNSEETRRYLSKTIENCGADPSATLSTEAISAVHHACLGVPRLVNQIMTEAIDIAEEAGESLITEVTIGRAWAQLQQLPSPMIEPPKIKGSNPLDDEVATIEFGELEDFEDSFEPNLEAELVEEIVSENVVTMCREDECEPDYPQSMNGVRESVEAESIRVLDTRALFGDFEEEEAVTVGTKAAPAIASSNRKTENPISEPATLPNEVGCMTHQEIVGISDSQLPAEYYAGAQADETSPVNDYLCSQDCDNCSCSGEEEEADSDEPAVVAFHIHDNADIESRYETDDEQPQRAVNDHRQSDIRIGDDSDLLVIEEDLDLSGEATAVSLASHERGPTIDFRSMLTRMRTGTEG